MKKCYKLRCIFVECYVDWIVDFAYPVYILQQVDAILHLSCQQYCKIYWHNKKNYPDEGSLINLDNILYLSKKRKLFFITFY